MNYELCAARARLLPFAFSSFLFPGTPEDEPVERWVRLHKMAHGYAYLSIDLCMYICLFVRVQIQYLSYASQVPGEREGGGGSQQQGGVGRQGGPPVSSYQMQEIETGGAAHLSDVRWSTALDSFTRFRRRLCRRCRRRRRCL